MMESLVKNCAFEAVVNNTTAGTTTINSSIVDLGTNGAFDSVCFAAKLGDVTDKSVITLKAICGNESDLSDGVEKENVATITADATSADNKLLILDVIKPGTRYVKVSIIRATANAAVESVIAIKYNAKAYPVTQGSGVIHSNISVN